MNIIISGMSCSGKSTFSNQISNSLHFKQDWYFKDKSDIPVIRNGYLFDSPNAFNMIEFKNDIDALLKEGYVYVPNYDVKTNTRIAKDRKVIKRDINIFEGLHTISELKHLRDSLKIFMDIPLEECLRRRVKRDIKYGIAEREVIKYFYEVMVPMYRMYIEVQKKDADLIIKGDDDVKCLLKKF